MAERAVQKRAGGSRISPILLIAGVGAVALAAKEGVIKIPSQFPPTTGAASLAMSAVITTSTVQVGQFARATITLRNTGTATAAVSVSGVTTLNGAVVGHWPAKSASVPAGQTVTLNMQSAAPIASNYAGDTLQVAFKGAY